ncbi:hypothetical protein HYS00_01590 [Candidatus Microgenomates bacterium]|nr:hypothetical protein [Candidatus Microgenomates bacterium]
MPPLAERLSPASPIPSGDALKRIAPSRPREFPQAPRIPFQEHLRSKEIRASNVAKHEIRHAIVAERLGYRVAVTSIKPEGPSLGRVVLSGAVRNGTDFQVFAAASSASGGDDAYVPEGTGHDRHQIENAGGAHSVESATATADRILSQYDPELLSRAARILDQQGEVIGSISSVLERAYIEMMHDRGEHQKAERVTKLHEERIAQEDEDSVTDTNEQTVIEHLSQDRIRITIYTDGVMTTEETKCNRCGALGGGHFDFCRHHSQTEHTTDDTSQNNQEFPPSEKPAAVGRRENIFTRATITPKRSPSTL